MPNRARFIVQIILLFLITLHARPPAAHEAPPSVRAELPLLIAPATSREGYFTLQLQSLPTVPLVVEYSTDPQFTQVTAQYPWFADFSQMTLSGFANGQHYFRLVQAGVDGSVPDQVGPVVMVRVQHYPLHLAIGLLCFGGAMFGLLVVMIVRGHWSSSRHE